MTTFELYLLVIHSLISGILVGYIWWAPDTKFKRAFIDGLSLRFIWGRFFK